MKRTIERPINRTGSAALLLIGMALLVGLTGYLVGDDRRLILLGLFGVLPLMVISLRYFEPIVLAMPLVALAIPISLPAGGSRISAAMLLVMLLAGIWILAAIVIRRGVTLQRSALNAPMLAFAAVCVLSFGWSIAFRDPLLINYPNFILVQLGALAALVLSPIAALLIANFARTPRQLWWIAAPFLVVGVAFSLARVLGRDVPVVNTRGLFPMWFVALAYAVAIAQPKLRLWMRIGLAAALGINLYAMAILQAEWLSGWVPSIVAIAAITLFRSRFWFLVLAAVLLAAGTLLTPFYQETFSSDREIQGNSDRLTLWELSWEHFQDHPLLGTGPAGYALIYVTYHPEEARSTHNNYLDIVSQTGVLGSLVWLWLVAAAVREGYVVLKHAPPGSLRTLGMASCGGLVASVVAMMLGDWVLPFAYNQGIEGFRYTVFSWIFLGVLMSIRRQVAPLTEPAARSIRGKRRFDSSGKLEHARAAARVP